MSENKRFTIKGTWSKSLNRLKGVIRDNNKDMYITDVVYLLNKLSEENVELKKELQKIYTIATINKVRYIVENIYDDLLYETSDESDYARTKVLKCLEDIDNLRDDLE